MRWGRVEVGAGFLLVVALALYWDDQGIVPLAIIACTLHELGHLVALKLLGGQLRCLRLSGVGAEMVIQGRLSYGGEIWLALAGPLANFGVALAVAKWGNDHLFCGLNFVLGTLNLLPVARLDGGRVLYSLCCMLFGVEPAGRVQWWLDWCCGLALLVLGMAILAVGGSFTLLILAGWMLWMQKTWNFHKKRLA